jgi:hypothetical protein
MKLIFFILIAASTGSFFILKKKDNKSVKPAPVKIVKSKPADNSAAIRLHDHAGVMKKYLKNSNCNKDFCFLIDMKIPSGKNRFFVYSLPGDSIITSGLTTHGSGSQTETDALIFSNIEGSYATSIGKYKIGEKYSGKFGTAYKLFGLDKTNSNAYVRAVVLHSHPYVPAQEVYPQPICLSWGCPTVSPSYLKVLEKYIDNSSKPVMLWIYY